MQETPIHINKLLAAKRQLQSAIRMYFLKEDELAIHTVASASYGLLKDIKSSKGISEASDVYLASFFYLIRDFHRGTLPSNFTEDSEIFRWLKRLAKDLPLINADTKLSELSCDISQVMEEDYWKDNNRVANFLKHANRDIDQTLQLDTVNNQLLLLKVSNAYHDIAQDDLGEEGIAFAAFIAASDNSNRKDGSYFSSIVETISNIPKEERKHFCYELIKGMRTK